MKVLLDEIHAALALGEYVLGDRAAYLGIVAEGHCGCGATRSDCTEGGHITEHFGQRSLGLYDAGTAAACLHAFDLTATLVKVTDHVTHALLGGYNLYFEDGLEKHGTGLFGGFLNAWMAQSSNESWSESTGWNEPSITVTLRRSRG